MASTSGPEVRIRGVASAVPTAGLHLKTSELPPKPARNDDIVFIDMDGDRRTESVLSVSVVARIEPRDILLQSNESSPENVYEIILRGEKLVKIENLDRFTKCRSLDLSSNYIERLENLKNLKDLRELKLYDNKISEISNLDKLIELNYLQLQHNRIATLGDGLCKLKKLKVLRIDNNQIMEINVKQLTYCSGLTSLDLSHNQLQDITALNCLPNLEELRVASNRLKQVSDLGRCRRLEEVDLSGNKLVDVSGLKGLPALCVLDLSKNLLSSLLSTGLLKKLRELNISDNKFRDVGNLVKLFPGLEILKMSNNRIEDLNEFSKLSNCENLVELYVDGNSAYDSFENHVTVNNELTSLLPNLDVLNGAQVHRKSVKSGAPLMRPMSANSIISVRQVEHQLRSFENEISAFETDLTKKFEAMASTISTLPEAGPRGGDSALREESPRPLTAGRRSQCSSRAKLRHAMAYASSNFDDA